RPHSPHCRTTPASGADHPLVALLTARYASAMSTSLSALPPISHPAFDALVAGLAEAEQLAFAAAAPLLGPLLEEAPYLLDQARTHAAWLAGALAEGPDAAFAGIIAELRASGTDADEAALSDTLRIGKGRTALLAAIAETGKLWTTA